LVERALRENWPIPDELRPALISRMSRILRSKKSGAREATSAAKAILSASKLNLESITAAIKAEEHEQLVGRVERLEKKSGKR
jgi:hypothetical protein